MPQAKTLLRKSFMVAAHVSGVASLARPLFQGVGAVLMLHRIGKPLHGSGLNGFLSVSPRFLDQLLDRMGRLGWRFVTLDETIDRLAAGHTDERFAAITLDDGYRDNLVEGAPVFRAHNVPYAIYVCPGLIEARAFLWWEVLALIIERYDRISFVTAAGPQVLETGTPGQKQAVYDRLGRYLQTEVDEDGQRRFVRELGRAYGIDVHEHCREEIMDWAALRQIAGDPLCTVGAHTINHHSLARLDRDRAAFEITQSAGVIEVELGERPAHFAYPYGNAAAVGQREVELVREAGYRSAVTTRHGLLRAGHRSHLHCLPRISVNGDYQRPHYMQTMLTGITVPVANRGRRLVTL